jgi:uncharacterized protein YndB with AHSA1/START domain
MTTTSMTVRHDAFTLSRAFEAEPETVFALFADEPTWRRWFKMPGSGASYAHDFRVGGGDEARADFRMPDGRVERLENRATYLAIAEPHRVVFAYTATVDDIPRWASLVAVTLAADGDGTSLTWTEQVALLHASDGTGDQDLAHLRGGLQLRFNAMAAALRG